MARYRVYLTAMADLTVTVEVDGDMDDFEAHEAAIEQALTVARLRGELCPSCTGLGSGAILDIGEWDVAQNFEGDIPPELVVEDAEETSGVT